MNRRRALAAISALAMLVACERKPEFRSVDVTGAHFGRSLKLTSHMGKPVTLADFQGKVVAIFFGYTQCPDICPTVLSQFAAVKQSLGTAADRFQVLFVTLDPQRDTPEVLKAYTTAFDSSFIGLYGTPAETATVANEFNIRYQQVSGDTPERYTLDHTAGTYLIDAGGRLRLFVRPNASAKDLTEDIRQLLEGY